MTIYGVVLAGGRGSRLGDVRKAELRLHGKTIIERVAARLQDCAVPLLIATGTEEISYEQGVSVPDHAAHGGPLEGLASAVRKLRAVANPNDVFVSVAVDTPFLPEDYVDRLVAALLVAPAAQAYWRGTGYPTNAAYRLAAVADLPERVATLESPRRLLAALDAVDVAWDDVATNPFANLNTLGDLLTLARLTE